jgi:hypothetical protein
VYEAALPDDAEMNRLCKTTKANPPLTCAEKIGPQCMLLPSHPRYQLRWSNDDEVRLTLLIIIIPHSESKGKAWFGKLTTGGSTGPSTKFILSKAEGSREISM